MSIRVMSRVWEESKHEGSALLTLLAIADFADDDGKAFPSKKTLAKKTRMSARSVQRLVQTLIASGELFVDPNAGRNGTNLYIVGAGGDKLSPPQVETPVTQGGDSPGSGGETPVTQGGDSPGSQTVIEPPKEPSGKHQSESEFTREENNRITEVMVPELKPLTTTPELLEIEDVVKEHPDWPTWYAVAYTVPGWTMELAKANNWRTMAKIPADLAERVAYALRDWWPTSSDKRQKKGDPYLTWQNWCRRDRDVAPGNGRGTQRQPVRTGQDFKGYGDQG